MAELNILAIILAILVIVIAAFIKVAVTKGMVKLLLNTSISWMKAVIFVIVVSVIVNLLIWGLFTALGITIILLL